MAVNITLETDEELAWRATQEIEAFEELYRRYKLTVYRYHLAQTGNEKSAQDLMLQTFLAAFESITSYDFRGRFVSWLFRIANTILEEHLRRWGFSSNQFTTLVRLGENNPAFMNADAQPLKCPANGAITIGAFPPPGTSCPRKWPRPGRGSAFLTEINQIAMAIDSLAEDKAEALILRFFAGLNSSEIGQIMDKSETAVKILVYRGLCDLLNRSPANPENEND